MALCWPSVLFLVYAFLSQANAAKTTLSPELTNFVPSCARECFATFLDSNFASTACGTKPTLDCLCGTKSTSEYTVGEGAVQCILSVISVGFCSEDDAKDSIAFKAYTMCNGKENALPNTHETLTATLIVQTSMPSTSVRTTSKSNFSASTAITASTTNPSTSPPTTLVTNTGTPPRSTTNTGDPSASTASPQAASEAPTPSSTLKREEIIGISVGSVAGAIAIAGLIFFACWRKKKSRQTRDSDMLPFQLDPSNSLNYSHGFQGPTERRTRGPGGTVNGVAGKVPPRVPPRIDTQSPNIFARRSIQPDMIGVAISPENKISTEKRQRRSSKLLPEKPTLTVKVPQQAEKQGNSLPMSQPAAASAVSRQSTATQFEEDFDDSADTAVAADDSWGRGSSDQILQPSTGNWQNIRQVNPNPAPAASELFVPGVGTTATTTPAPEHYAKSLNLARGPVGSFSQPRRPDAYPVRSQNYPQHPHYQQQQQQVQPQRPQLHVAVPAEAERPLTTSSSIYTAHASLPPSDSGRNSNPRPTSGSRAKRSYKSAGPYDSRQSGGSLTSFETNDSAVVSPQDFESNQKPILNLKTDVENRRRTLPLDLSPVVESPPSGRSPVSYPKIPARGRLPENTIRMVPPPKQPDFTAVFFSGRAGGGPSPVGPSPVGVSPIDGSMKPWRAAEIQAQLDRERGKTGIEVGMSKPSPQTQPQFPQRMQSLRTGTGQIWPGQGMGPPPPRTQAQSRRQEREYIAPSAHFNLKAAPPPRSNTGPNSYALAQSQNEEARPYQPLTRQNTAPPTSSFSAATQNPQNPLMSHPSLTFTRSSSQASFHSQTSTSSSLLTKRRGEQKALALNLRNETGEGRGQGGKWRVLGKDEIAVAKSEGWRPMLGNNEREREGGHGGFGSGGTEGATGELPRTPGWVPRLTPTRRGDELFLSVQ